MQSPKSLPRHSRLIGPLQGLSDAKLAETYQLEELTNRTVCFAKSTAAPGRVAPQIPQVAMPNAAHRDLLRTSRQILLLPVPVDCLRLQRRARRKHLSE